MLKLQLIQKAKFVKLTVTESAASQAHQLYCIAACSAGLIRSYTIVDYKLEQYFSLTPN